MISKKDKLSKKPTGKVESSFTDDGFALGLAYILKLLEQDMEFDGLHWWDSVTSYLNKRRQDIAEQKVSKVKKPTEEDLQHLMLTQKKLQILQTEFELLFYSFTGARIFFRDPTAAAKKDEAGAAADP